MSVTAILPLLLSLLSCRKGLDVTHTTIGTIRSPSITQPIRFLPKAFLDRVVLFDSTDVYFGATPGQAQQWSGGVGLGTLPVNTSIRWAAGTEFWLITRSGVDLVTVGFILTELPPDA